MRRAVRGTLGEKIRQLSSRVNIATGQSNLWGIQCWKHTQEIGLFKIVSESGIGAMFIYRSCWQRSIWTYWATTKLIKTSSW